MKKKQWIKICLQGHTVCHCEHHLQVITKSLFTQPWTAYGLVLWVYAPRVQLLISLFITLHTSLEIFYLLSEILVSVSCVHLPLVSFLFSNSQTWISNRRRKYRLMGIEIPPPKGGPAVFTTSSPGNESPLALSPDEERLRTPELGDDLNDEGSVCLSEGETKNVTRTDTHA